MKIIQNNCGLKFLKIVFIIANNAGLGEFARFAVFLPSLHCL